MLVKNKSKDKHIYVGLWVSNENRTKQKHFNFALTSESNAQEVDFENVGGITGDLFIKTTSAIDFQIDDFVFWKGFGNNKKYNIVSITESNDNELAHINFKNHEAKIIHLRRAG